MKNNKLFNIFVLMLLFLLGWVLGQCNMIWLDGVMIIIFKGWGGIFNVMCDFYNYDFVDLVFINLVGSQEYDLSLGVRDFDILISFIVVIQMEFMLDNRSNVFGIVYDFGGLVLWELANWDNSLFVMIFDGVFN